MILADARHLPIASGTVQCTVTSPPYWGLRAYGCGDREIGQELDYRDYIVSLVDVFRDVRRVLRDDGVLWLNLGDCHANDGKWGGETGGKQAYLPDTDRRVGREKRITELKPKDLVGIPWAVAFALRDDGWYLRQDIIWAKPNPMPESVTDRPATAHEHVFLFSKSERYFYDVDAVKEPGIIPAGTRAAKGSDVRSKLKDVNGRPPEYWEYTGLRNCRSVWTINTQNYDGSHFATMPEKLVERCVLAGSRPGDLVFDPFLGSGTVARVAISLARRAVGCDLQRDYLQLQRERMTVTRGLPLEMEASA